MNRTNPMGFLIQIEKKTTFFFKFIYSVIVKIGKEMTVQKMDF